MINCKRSFKAKVKLYNAKDRIFSKEKDINNIRSIRAKILKEVNIFRNFCN